MRIRTNRRWIVVPVLMAVALAAEARDVSITAAEWRQGADAAHAVLRLALDGRPERSEVRAQPDGTVIRLAGTATTTAAPDDVEFVSDGGTLEVRIARPTSRLIGVRSGDDWVEIEVEDVFAAAAEGYRLGPGDVLSVAVYEDPSLTGEYTIGQDGTINFPLVGAIPAVGISESELANRIRSRISDYLDAPSISVTILSFESQSVHVNIAGESPRAAKVALRPGMRFNDVLAEAGVALLEGQRLEIARSSGGERGSIALDAATVDAPDAPLPRDGDVVTVLEPAYVFIRGEVRKPGRWIHRPGLTLQRLIALSGGLTEWASRKDILIRRPDGEGFEDVNVNLKRVEEGRDPDPELGPADLVLVRRRVL